MKKIITIAAALLASSALFAQKFAHVDYQECLYLMDDIIDAQIQLNAVQKETEDTYREMVQDYQAKYETYQQKSASWTPSVRDTKGRELQELEQRITEFGQTSQQELAQVQQNLLTPIAKKVSDAVEKVAKAGNYIYVFDVTSIRYIDPKQSDDITMKVRAELKIPADRTAESFAAETQAKLEAAAR